MHKNVHFKIITGSQAKDNIDIHIKQNCNNYRIATVYSQVKKKKKNIMESLRRNLWRKGICLNIQIFINQTSVHHEGDLYAILPLVRQCCFWFYKRISKIIYLVHPCRGPQCQLFLCFHRALRLINTSVSFPHEAGVEYRSGNAVDSDFVGYGSIRYGFSGNASSAAKWQGNMFLVAVKIYQQANWDPLSPTYIPDAWSTSLPLCRPAWPT